MIVYYSGTGNSRRAAQILASGLGDSLVDATPYIRESRQLTLQSQTPWVFCAPTYGWQLPHVFRDLLLQGDLQGSREAYFLMTCGSGVGNAEAHLKKLCAAKGLRYMGLLPVAMPENYLAMFEVPQARRAAAIVRLADGRIKQLIPAIRAGEALPAVPAGLSGKLMSGLVNTVFTKVVVTAKPFYATEGCVGCGKCTQICPVGNISLNGGRPVWGGKCIHCMACISYCPTQAIEYGKKSQGKPRWQCPEWEETK